MALPGVKGERRKRKRMTYDGFKTGAIPAFIPISDYRFGPYVLEYLIDGRMSNKEEKEEFENMIEWILNGKEKEKK